MRPVLVLQFTIFAMATCPLMAHPPDEHGEHHAAEQVSFPQGIVLPQLEGPKPWSDKPVLNEPGRFHFAVMTDRTGGHRPGVWMKGVRQLNLMRPEFVVSVGDLIEGYSEDENTIHQEWREFLGFIDRLDMRFFFVAGNHDVTNPLMHRIWRDHFGPEWYSFDYQGVHFVCLSSEDPLARIGEEQLKWIAADLNQHADARWTFVMLHKPLWRSADRELAAGNADPTNWKKVEAMLGDRPHTVFAGHVHHYVQYDRRGSKYYHLATTGGSSRLRGQPYGEFDHVVWVTMENDGPRVANLLLDGVLPADVVTEKSITRFRDFLAKSKIQVAPILIESGERIAEGQIHVRLQNDFSEAVQLSGRIDGLPLRGLSLDEAPLTLVAKSGDQNEIAVAFRLEEALHFQHFAQTTLTAKLRSTGDDPLTAELTLPVTIDRRYACPRLEIVLDGDLGEWTGEEYQLSAHPLLYGATDRWQGPTDGAFRFRIAHDEEHVFLSGTVSDDRLVPGDRVFFYLDGRDFDVRVNQPRLGEHSYAFEMSAPVGDTPAAIRITRPRRSPLEATAKVATKPTADGYSFEVALPIAMLTRAQGADWKSFQLTPVLGDVDEAQDNDTYVVWRGSTNLLRQNTNLGHFFRAAAN